MTKTRIITALVLAPLMIFGIFFLPLKQFAYFIAAIATIGAWEWANIAGYTKNWSRVLYAVVMFVCLFVTARFLNANESYLIYFLAVGTLWWVIAFALVKQYPGGTELWHARPVRALLGLCVLIPMWVGFMHLKQQPYSSLLIIYLMLIIWGADTGAYFAGRKWGKAKLAPNVSPGKSWAGFWGGFTTSLLVGAGFLVYINSQIQAVDIDFAVTLFMITVITAVVSVLGDLVESMMKRHRGI
ncbi:hypothetical protein A3759_26845, partial [Thalassolituus sp. HI0120]